MTELFLFGIQAPVPPACRTPLRTLGAWRLIGADEAVLDLAPLRPSRPVTHVLPALSIVTSYDYAFRFSARIGAGSPWTHASGVGAVPPIVGDAYTIDAGLAPDVDVFRAREPITEVSISVRVRSRERDAALAAPALVTVSLSDETVELDGPTRADPVFLSVPPLSQMDAPGPIRSRVCSPTCVAMVLEHWRITADLASLAADIYDPRLDLYGVWPAAIAAAARRGLHGYLLRFPSWGAAEWCLREGLPVIASVRYGPGELRGAAIPSTAGHLIVLTGQRGEDVLVNDPAAPTAASVPRAYRLEDLQRVWLARSGVGYVLFPPRSLTAA